MKGPKAAALRTHSYIGKPRGLRAIVFDGHVSISELESAARRSSLNGTCTANVASMSITRLPRNTRQKPVRVSLLIEERKKDRLHALAAHAGVSAAVFLERMIDHLDDELTDRGLPTWWPAPQPNDGELPIDSA